MFLLANPCNPPVGLDGASVRDTVDDQRETLAECATEDAELDVRIHIQPDGRVEGVRARGSARVGPCVERIVGSWEFDRADGPTDVEVPVRLLVAR